MTRAWYTAVGVAAMVAIACEGQAQGTPGSSPFDGFYGGVFVGNKSTDVRTLTTIDSAFGTTRLPGSTTSESTFFVDRDGEIDREQLVGGLRLGFGRTFGAFHLGGEIDAQLGDSTFEFHLFSFDPANPDFQRLELKESVSPAIRLGYVAGPGVLLFARLGWTFTRLEAAFSNFFNTTGSDIVSGSATRWIDGPRLGFGAEVAVGGGFSLRADAGRTFYRDDSFPRLRSTAPLGSAGDFRILEIEDTIVALGVSYRFGAGAEDASRPGLAAWTPFAPTAGPFDGVYGGLFAGDRSASVRTRTTVAGSVFPTVIIGSSQVRTAEFGDNGEIDADRLIGGARIGVGRAVDRFYLGGEVEAQFGNSLFEFNILRFGGGIPDDFQRLELKQSVSPAFRFGYLVNDSLLLFGRLGWAFTRVDAAFSDFTNTIGGAVAASASEWIDGPRIGVGADIRLGQGLVLRADAARTYYRDGSLPRLSASEPAGSTGVFEALNIDETTFTVGFNYQFGARPSAGPDAPQADFDGFYVGFDGGNRGARAKTRTRVNNGMATTEISGDPNRRDRGLILPNGRIDEDRLIGSVLIGHGRSFGPIYLGGELGVQFGDSTFEFNVSPQGAAGTDIARVELKEAVTPSLRVGYIVVGGVLLYGRAGWNFVRTTGSFRNFAFTSGSDIVEGSETTWANGPLFGGGAEVAIGDRWRFRIDATSTRLRNNLPEIRDTAPLGSIGDFSVTEASETTFKAGFTFRL